MIPRALIPAVGDMAAASERIEEYRSQSAQFCKRMFDFLARAVKQHVGYSSNPTIGLTFLTSQRTGRRHHQRQITSHYKGETKAFTS